LSGIVGPEEQAVLEVAPILQPSTHVVFIFTCFLYTIILLFLGDIQQLRIVVARVISMSSLFLQLLEVFYLVLIPESSQVKIVEKIQMKFNRFGQKCTKKSETYFALS
jgi:CBS domain containing-hemolysin-like protein